MEQNFGTNELRTMERSRGEDESSRISGGIV